MKYTRKHIDRCVESATYQQKGSLRLDRDAGIVYGVKVLGWSGKGGQRIYRRPAVEKALPLYDGAVVNLNHAKVSDTDLTVPDRDVTTRFGRIINPRVTDEGLYGDLKFNRKHWYADTFTGWVEDDPAAIGLSHDAILQGPTTSDGKRSIESIPKVFSVDLVADPGSTKGLHEDNTPEEEHTDASIDMDDMNDDDGGDDAEEHLCSYIVSIVKDKSLSVKERMAKINDAMKLMEGSEEEPEESNPEPEMKDEKTEGKESLALSDAERVELDALRAEKQRRGQESKARQKCIEAELPEYLVTDTFVDVMTRSQESAWEGLIKDRKVQVGEKPTSIPPTPGNKKPSLDEFEKFVRGESN